MREKIIVNIYESELAFKILTECVKRSKPTEISKRTNLSPQVVSKYLRVLRKENLVRFKKVGKERFYEIKMDKVVQLLYEKTKESVEAPIYKSVKGNLVSAGTYKIKEIEKAVPLMKELKNDKLFKDFLAIHIQNLKNSRLNMIIFLATFFLGLKVMSPYKETGIKEVDRLGHKLEKLNNIFNPVKSDQIIFQNSFQIFVNKYKKP